ncbi:hypothetical protein GGER_21070 [Serratia rubidaea]
MEYDLIVVGSGSVGAAAGYYATQAGLKVLMIDSEIPRTATAATTAIRVLFAMPTAKVNDMFRYCCARRPCGTA